MYDYTTCRCSLDHLPLFAFGFAHGELLLQQLHSLGQLLVPEAETVHLLLLLPQALVPLLQLVLVRIRNGKKKITVVSEQEHSAWSRQWPLNNHNHATLLSCFTLYSIYALTGCVHAFYYVIIDSGQLCKLIRESNTILIPRLCKMRPCVFFVLIHNIKLCNSTFLLLSAFL